MPAAPATHSRRAAPGERPFPHPFSALRAGKKYLTVRLPAGRLSFTKSSDDYMKNVVERMLFSLETGQTLQIQEGFLDRFTNPKSVFWGKSRKQIGRLAIKRECGMMITTKAKHGPWKKLRGGNRL